MSGSDAGWNEWAGLWWPVVVKLMCFLPVYGISELLNLFKEKSEVFVV